MRNSEKLRIPSRNLIVIDFHLLFNRRIVKPLWEDLKTYDIVNTSISDKDVKKFYYHHIINELMTELLDKENNNGKVIIHYQENNTDFGGLEFHHNLSSNGPLKSVLSNISKLFPIRFYRTSMNFRELQRIFEEKNGHARDITLTLQSLCDNFKVEQYSFRKVKHFVEKHGLVGLDQKIFNEIQSKQIVLS